MVSVLWQSILVFFSFRAFTQSFLSKSCDELFLSKQWTMFLHMVVSKILKFYERNDLWLQHKSWDVQVVCVRDPFTWNLQCAWVQCIFRFVKCYRNFAHLLVRLCPPNYYWHPRIFRPSDGPVYSRDLYRNFCHNSFSPFSSCDKFKNAILKKSIFACLWKCGFRTKHQ